MTESVAGKGDGFEGFLVSLALSLGRYQQRDVSTDSVQIFEQALHNAPRDTPANLPK